MKYFEDILANRDYLDPDERLLLEAHVGKTIVFKNSPTVTITIPNGAGVVGVGGMYTGPQKGDVQYDGHGDLMIYDGSKWMPVPAQVYRPPAMPAGLPPSLTGGISATKVRVVDADMKVDGCPKCGHKGAFVRMALCCPNHGAFGGC